MKKWARDVRLMPIVLMAIVCLLVLKTMGLLFDGGYTLGQRLGSGGTLTVTTVPMAQTQQMRSPSVPLEMPQQPGAPKQPSFMQEMFGYPGGDRSAIASGRNPDITGSVAAKPAEKKDEKKDEKKAEPANKEPAVPVGAESIAARGTVVSMDQQRPASPGERALLERLQERRQELEARMRELELRESLVKAAEKKLETGRSPEGDKAARGASGQSRDEAQSTDEGRRHHVRDDEAQGRREDLRPARPQGASGGGEPDQAAADVGDHGGDVARGGRAPDRRACDPGPVRPDRQSGEPAQDRRQAGR